MQHGGANAPGTGDYCMFMAYVKADEITDVLFEAQAGSGETFKMWVDMSTGTIGDTSGTAYIHGVEPLQDDWYLCWALVVTVTSNTCKMRLYPSTGTTSGDETYAGNASDGFLACGLHLNLDIRTGGYYRGPTTGSDVTQVRDEAEIATTGWFNATEGTFLVEFYQFQWQAAHSVYLLSIRDESAPADEYMNIYTNAHLGTGKTKIFKGGSVEWDGQTTAPGLGVGGYTKICSAYKLNDCQLVIDGLADTVETSAAMAVNQDKMVINRFNTDGTRAGVQYQRIRYWNTRLTEAEMVALTT
jgi:hypothetical protein